MRHAIQPPKNDFKQKGAVRLVQRARVARRSSLMFRRALILSVVLSAKCCGISRLRKWHELDLTDTSFGTRKVCSVGKCREFIGKSNAHPTWPKRMCAPRNLTTKKKRIFTKRGCPTGSESSGCQAKPLDVLWRSDSKLCFKPIILRHFSFVKMTRSRFYGHQKQHQKR